MSSLIPSKINIHDAYESLTRHFKCRILILGVAFGKEDGTDEMLVWRFSGRVLFVGIKAIRSIFDEQPHSVFDRYETE